MIRRLPLLLGILGALLPVAHSAFAQSALQVSVVASGSSNNVAPGGSLALTATDPGQTILANVTVKYAGTSSATITGVSVAGSSEITLLLGPQVPMTLNPGASTTFTVQYTGTSGNSTSAQVSIAYTETQASAFQFTLTGTSPKLSLSYYFAPSGSLTNLNAGDTITFPSTNVGASAQAVVTVLNRGSAPGTIQAISLSGSAFQVTGSPAPAHLQPGQQASFTVNFAPTATGTSQGLLSVTLASSSMSFSLVGPGTSTSFSFSYALSDGNLRPLTSGSVIAFPSLDVNGTSNATVTILNQGTGSGSVTGISVSGAGFQLTSLPLLPATVAAGQSLRFGISFTPNQVGSFSGSLSINAGGTSISALLSGSTSASNLTATYAIGNSTGNPLNSGSVIAFPAIDVNATSTTTVTIQNQGAGAGTVSSISVSGTGFQLVGSPALPATIPAGQSFKFSIVFQPTQAGSFNGNFAIAGNGIALSGALTGSTTTPNFSVSYTLSDAIVHAFSSGTTISFPSIDINASTTATLTIQNQGSGSGSLSNVSVSGTGFQLSSLPLLPVTIAAGQSFRIGIIFKPTQAGTYNGSFQISLTGATFTGSLTGSTAPSNISLFYVDPATNNTVALTSNSTLQFPNTQAGTVANITVVAANSGTGTGFINAVTIGGSSAGAFQVINLPVLPLSVAPSQQARFGVRFSPQQQDSFAATLSVDINGQITTVNIAAQGTAAQYTYSVTTESGTTALSAGATLAMADTNVGQTSAVTVTITNNGTADGQISGIGVTGQGLSLSGLPAGALTLHPNGSQQFKLTFAPQQPGAVKGQLTVGGDTFVVEANAIGSKLSFTYTNTAASTSISEGGAIIFTPSSVGSSQSLTFSIQNTGTSAATISSINLTTPSTVFSLQQLPALPMNLNPGASVTFAASFVPNNTGTLTAILAVNTSTFTLSGTGTQPAALPAYQFQGPSGTQQPAQQPAIGLSLSAPYPLALRGTLTLSFSSSVFTDDPSIQFANGGRTIGFTIPANTTQALFNGSASSVPLQTGTTAGTIAITPSFAMQSGFDMTPSSPAALNLTIQRVAPQLLNAGVTSETLTGFNLILSGYSTGRNLKQFDIELTPKQGANFSSTHLTVDVTSPASAWFQSAASQAFGGSFSVAIPFSLQNGSSNADLVHMLQSLSITATNDVGASTAVSVQIP